MHTEFAGERLMTEGLRLVLRHAFRKVKLVRLEANIQPGNERSKVLIGGCGFQYQGSRLDTLKSAACGAIMNDGRSEKICPCCSFGIPLGS